MFTIPRSFVVRFSEDVADEYRTRYRIMHTLLVTAHRAERDVRENAPRTL